MTDNLKNIDNIKSRLQNVKLIYERLLDDINLYQKYLENLSNEISCLSESEQNHKFDFNNKLENISEIFYQNIQNHLSIVDIDNGFTKMIPNVDSNGYESIINFVGNQKIFGNNFIKTIQRFK